MSVHRSATSSGENGDERGDLVSDAQLTALLQLADPWPTTEMVAPDIDALIAQASVGARLPRTPPRADHRRRWVLIGGAAVAGLALTAAALHGPVWTGVFAQGTPSGQVVVGGVGYQNADGTDTSELIDSSAPGAEDVLRTLEPRELPLPPWVSWNHIVDHTYEIVKQPDWGIMSAQGFRMTFVANGIAAWQVEWLDADQAGDQIRVQKALDGWQRLLKDYQGVLVPEQVDVPYAVLRSARADDRSAVSRDVELNAPAWIADAQR